MWLFRAMCGCFGDLDVYRGDTGCATGR